MPLSHQEISDICTSLFRVDTRSNQQRAGKRTLQSSGAALLSGNAVFNPTAAERAEVLRSLATWAQMDDTAFEAIFFYHPHLAKIMRWLVLQVADVSGSRHNNNNKQQHPGGDAHGEEEEEEQPIHTKENVAHIRTVIARCVLWQPVHDPAGAAQDPTVLNDRLDALFPADCITAVSLILGKSSPLLGSVAISCWALQAPAAVATLSAFGGMWNSRVQELNATCNALARHGRFERTHRDVTTALHSARALVLGVWALLHSCPFLVDSFSSLPRLVTSARIIAEEVAPALQHFIFTCDRLAGARPQLVRMVQKIANAAVDMAATCMIFSQHWSSANNSSFKEYIRVYDRVLSEHVRDRGGFVARLLLRGTAANPERGGGAGSKAVGSVRDALRHILPPSTLAVPDDSERLRGFRDALPMLEDTSSSSAHSAKTSGIKMHATFFAEQVLRRIAQQKVKLIPDDAPGMGLPKGANNPDARGADGDSSSQQQQQQQQQQQSAAHDMSEDAQLAAATADCKYPDLVPVVCEFLPQLGPVVAARALDYYQGNTERLMDDAMSGNLPPHIENAEAPAAAAGPPASTAAEIASSSSTLAPVDRASQVYDLHQLAQSNNNNNSNAKDADETLLHLLVGDIDASTQGATSEHGGDDDDDDDQFAAAANDDDDDDDANVAGSDAFRIYGKQQKRANKDFEGMRMMGRASTSDDWTLAPMEQGLVDKTRELMERMYTDELDDAGIAGGEPDVRPLKYKSKNVQKMSDDDDDDGEEDEAAGQQQRGGGGAAAAAGGDGDDVGAGTFFSRRMNARSQADKKKDEEGEDGKAAQPAYHRKPKTDWRRNEQKRHQQTTRTAKSGASGKQSTKQLMKAARM